MMIKHIAIWTMATLLPVAASAQARSITLEQAVLGQGGQFRPKVPMQLAWRPQHQAFTYVDKGCLVQQAASKQAEDTLLRRADLKRLFPEDTPGYLWYSWLPDGRTIRLTTSNGFAEVDVQALTLKKTLNLPDKAEHADLSPDGNLAAYTIGNNLYISDGRTNKPITDEKEDGIVCGQSVHRNEFGISGGIFWAPNSQLLAYYRMDERMVSQYPLVDITTRVATHTPIRYPMAGMKSHEVTVRVYDRRTGSTITLKTGEPREQYLTNIAWDPSSEHIYIAIINREQNHLWLNRYNAKTGEREATLFEEQDPQYVEPQNAPFFLPDSPSQFIWQSRRDGWNHLYLYNSDGQMVRQLTSGRWEVTELTAYSPEQHVALVMTTRSGAINRQACAVNVRTGELRPITPGEGTHYIKPSADLRYVADFSEAIDQPGRVDIYQLKGLRAKRLRTAVQAADPYQGYDNVPMPKIVPLTNPQGDTLWARIITPKRLEPGKRYPTVVYVYGGPHSQLVSNCWLGGARLWESYMASLGYIMFTIDGRGTSDRGADFEQAIHRQLGVCELVDQMVGVQYLKRQPFVDTNRIGVHGWSFGGFMTISMMLKAADVFKVGVAGGPVTDWRFYEVMYGERYMDTPQENPDGYAQADLKNYADLLRGRLLMIHGDIDNTVVPQHSLTLIKEFVSKRKQVDFFMYPQHEHNVRGRDRVHLIDKVIKYFQDFL